MPWICFSQLDCSPGASIEGVGTPERALAGCYLLAGGNQARPRRLLRNIQPVASIHLDGGKRSRSACRKHGPVGTC